MDNKISTRISIRWLPDAASEPTDTLVFSVGGWYIDLRILKEDGSIDWAMAGERVVTSKDPLKVLFTKTIDSHASPTSTEPSPLDEGEFTTLPNGDSLETGSMPNPSRNNEMTPYEEVWRVLSPRPGGGVAYILESCDNDSKGNEAGRKIFIGRIGGQVLILTEKKTTNEGVKRSVYGARSEEWIIRNGLGVGWGTKYEVGGVALENVPSYAKGGILVDGMPGEEGWKKGDEVSILEVKYVVRGYEKFEETQ